MRLSPVHPRAEETAQWDVERRESGRGSPSRRTNPGLHRRFKSRGKRTPFITKQRANVLNCALTVLDHIIRSTLPSLPAQLMSWLPGKLFLLWSCSFFLSLSFWLVFPVFKVSQALLVRDFLEEASRTPSAFILMRDLKLRRNIVLSS